DVAGLADRADDPAGEALGHVGDEPDGNPVGRDRRLLQDARPRILPPVGRFERHFAEAAAAFLAPGQTGAAEASLRSCFLVRFSVPTSVSLSSPRMNASTRWRAMSSWIWTGGLFMK